jgi:hypothetical protein
MQKALNILALAMLALLSACSGGGMGTPRQVAVEGKFSVEIPSNFIPCNDLHDFAQLQYADERGGYFMMLIDEPKTDIDRLQMHYSLADYADFVETTVGQAFDTMHVSQRDTLEINGLQCQTAHLYAAIDSEEAPMEVYYHLAVFESMDHFYQLIGWTHRDRQSTLRAAAEEMAHSFHELATDANELQTASAQKAK